VDGRHVRRLEDGLNNAVKELRDALEDSREHPRFIETVPRRGYR
jgi:DNA-binding winged helix-turn-helix (wHTH) protein